MDAMPILTYNNELPENMVKQGDIVSGSVQLVQF